MYSPVVWSLWGPMGERKTNSATVLILRIDTCLFKIKNQSLKVPSSASSADKPLIEENSIGKCCSVELMHFQPKSQHGLNWFW